MNVDVGKRFSHLGLSYRKQKMGKLTSVGFLTWERPAAHAHPTLCFPRTPSQPLGPSLPSWGRPNIGYLDFCIRIQVPVGEGGDVLKWGGMASNPGS